MTQVEAANSNPNEAFVKAFQETQEWNASFNWPEPRTFVYKEVDGIKIEADVYAREPTADDHAAAGSPIMVFIHGGGWMGGTRTDFSRPTFHEFITRGFVIVSIDYRLLPEVDFLTGQLQDIASAEGWIREKFQADLKEAGSRVKVDTDRIVVSGASAGAHLASLVPKIWKKMPQSILLVAGPTNLFEVRRLGRPLGGGALAELSKFIPMDPSAEFIKSAMFPTPQTSIPQTPGLEGFMQPRSLLGLSVFLKSVLPEFIVLGLVDGKLPEKGTAKEEDLKYISAFFDDVTNWPPTFQMIGDNDEAWEASQLTSLHDKLRNTGIPSGVLVVPESSHGFDVLGRIGGKTHLRYIQPACEFVIRFVMDIEEEKKF